MASPADAVRTLFLKPMIPREGMVNSICMRSFCVSIDCNSPFRRVTISMILLAYSSGRLTVSCSTGSHFIPSISLMITWGCPTWSSYPSRRIVSIRTDKCRTPRPYTVHTSAFSAFSTRNAKLRSSSLVRRSAIWREVTNLPSFPKKGESLLVKVIDIVGSSIAIRGKGSGFCKSVIVSPISNPSIPTKAQISPELAFSTFVRPKPSNKCNSLIRLLVKDPSFLHNATSIPSRSSPRWIRPMAIRPT